MFTADRCCIQQRIIAVSDQGSIEFYADDLSAFHHDESDYESIPWKPKTGNASRKFCKRIVSGEIAILRCDVLQNDTTGKTLVVPTFYLKKNNLVVAATLGHLEGLLSGFKPRPSGSFANIITGTWDLDTLISIVRQYNSYLRPKTSH